MNNRMVFEILRFYIRIILWGDPTEPKPKPKQRPKAKPAARLEPVPHTK